MGKNIRSIDLNDASAVISALPDNVKNQIVNDVQKSLTRLPVMRRNYMRGGTFIDDINYMKASLDALTADVALIKTALNIK